LEKRVRVPVLTIDGPVSSGKGTVARRVAAKLGWHLLDSGALYRVLGYYARAQGVALNDEQALVPLAEKLPVTFVEREGDTCVWLEDEDVSLRIRTEEIGALASQVAVFQGVRLALRARQQAFAKPPGLVADGRDMGTVVFPDAVTKIFLTASVEERARRRYNQLKEKGLSAKLAPLVEDIRARDARDRHRKVAPLVPAADAQVIDSTEMTIDQVVNRILEQVARIP
jgi:cytidylate kinase